MCYSVLQCVARPVDVSEVWYVAVCCSVVQRVAVCCSVSKDMMTFSKMSALQCVAMCCRVLHLVLFQSCDHPSRFLYTPTQFVIGFDMRLQQPLILHDASTHHDSLRAE